MTTTAETFSGLQQHAETIRNDEAHDLRGRMDPGDAWAQGDVLIRRLDTLPADAMQTDTRLQLAPGETQGSRHCLESGDGITMYRRQSPTTLEGPLFTATQDVTVEHPEHGDVILGPGIYAIEYQRTGEDMQSMRRTQD